MFRNKSEEVKCDGCKCILNKSDAQKVTSYGFAYSYDRFYCGLCKKPYTSINSIGMITIYNGEVAMDEEGVPIGYQKIPPRKDKRTK